MLLKVCLGRCAISLPATLSQKGDEMKLSFRCHSILLHENIWMPTSFEDQLCKRHFVVKSLISADSFYSFSQKMSTIPIMANQNEYLKMNVLSRQIILSECTLLQTSIVFLTNNTLLRASLSYSSIISLLFPKVILSWIEIH